MTTTTIEKTELSRILDEGYGPGAWHGPDLKAALADVGPKLAFWRPAPGRHNIAEIALHHAFYVRSVRGQISGTPPEPFVLEGEDWFDPSGLSWPEIQAVVEEQQSRLVAAVADTEPDAERFNLVLGITCHAIYHAGQVQLIKRLNAG
jgi:hypothetical protein